MNKLPKSILTLTAPEALDFLMNSERYCTFELPEYFDFQPMLDFVRKRVGDTPYLDCLASDPCKLNNVNQDVLLNKDGRYAIRPLALVNPYLYYFLVRELCSDRNWKALCKGFKLFHTPNITACAIPVIPEKKEQFHNSTTVLNWWNMMEQRTVELSMEYKYMFVTDITNCYGSINPQMLDNALAMRDTKFETKDNRNFASSIVKILQAMQGGRNIGIPQGSVLFDLVAEIILGYADLLLAEKIGSNVDYKVLRYRDDYRIFCNDRNKLEEISYMLQLILRQLNFQMNSKKTMVSDDILSDAIKPDKQFYVFNTPITRKRRVYSLVTDNDGKQKLVSSVEQECDYNGLQKNLLFIRLFGRKFPNCGQLKTLLNEFDARLVKLLDDKNKTMHVNVYEDVDTDSNDYDTTVKETSTSLFSKIIKEQQHNHIIENIRPMVAIATQIAQENICAAHYALRIVSRLISTLDDNDKNKSKEKRDIIDKVRTKLRNQYNANYLEIWLQNMTYNLDCIHDESKYEMPLCRLVMNDRITLWNNAWLTQPLTFHFPQRSIVNRKLLKELSPVIKIKARYGYDE